MTICSCFPPFKLESCLRLYQDSFFHYPRYFLQLSWTLSCSPSWAVNVTLCSQLACDADTDAWLEKAMQRDSLNWHWFKKSLLWDRNERRVESGPLAATPSCTTMKHICRGVYLHKGPRFHNWGVFHLLGLVLRLHVWAIKLLKFKKRKKETCLFPSGIWVLECTVYMNFIILQECNPVREGKGS